MGQGSARRAQEHERRRGHEVRDPDQETGPLGQPPEPGRDAPGYAFLAVTPGGYPNRQISAKPLAVYFPDMLSKLGEEAVAAQCIPTDPGLLEIDSYKNFLAVRREAIAVRLNEYLGTSGP